MHPGSDKAQRGEGIRCLWEQVSIIQHRYFFPHAYGGLLQASQDFRPEERSVVNFGQILGDGLYVTAEGTYEPQVRDGHEASSKSRASEY